LKMFSLSWRKEKIPIHFRKFSFSILSSSSNFLPFGSVKVASLSEFLYSSRWINCFPTEKTSQVLELNPFSTSKSFLKRKRFYRSYGVQNFERSFPLDGIVNDNNYSTLSFLFRRGFCSGSDHDDNSVPGNKSTSVSSANDSKREKERPSNEESIPTKEDSTLKTIESDTVVESTGEQMEIVKNQKTKLDGTNEDSIQMESNSSSNESSNGSSHEGNGNSSSNGDNNDGSNKDDDDSDLIRNSTTSSKVSNRKSRNNNEKSKRSRKIIPAQTNADDLDPSADEISPKELTLRMGEPVNALVNQNKSPTPENVLAIPLYRRPFFPGNFAPLMISDVNMLNALRGWMKKTAYVGLFLAKDESLTHITDLNQLSKVGILGVVNRIEELQNGKGGHVLVTGFYRIEIIGSSEKYSEDGKLFVKIRRLMDEPYDASDGEIRAYNAEIVKTLRDLIQIAPHGHLLSEQLAAYKSIINTFNAGDFADLAASITALPEGSLFQEVLNALNIKERQLKALQLLKTEIELTKIQNKISKQIEEDINKNNRQHLLKQQLKLIKKELGLEQDDKQSVIDKFSERIKKCKVPDYAMKVINEEMAKFSSLETASSEYNLTRNYLDWLTILPWGVYKEENLDVRRAEKILNEDHYGLKDVKERILEFIAVGKLKSGVQGKILCLLGPPGVGKTSIGKSVARALSRDFFRFSVGGMSDVAEIKGHRRTYIGAMPGKIIQCLKSVKSSNPVILIDEIDKLGRGYQGDPASALLEVLDPEQNKAFLDHYLDVPVDISKVLFIVTANVKDTIPGPLLDRMEVINLSGYVTEEKFHIARNYLIPNTCADCGLKKSNVFLSDKVIRNLIVNYCREAGVRNLQKHIEKIFRKVAYKVVKSKTKHAKISISEQNLSDYVGKPVFNSDKYYEKTPCGVVMGLAWTRMGGATLYVESVVDKMNNKPQLKTTGQLGEVMKESTDIAYTYAKTFIGEVAHGNRFFETANIHMHIPEGATPKDGPSAGITMVTSLLSLALEKEVKANLAMTGELTLTGKILPIGGVKEKTIASKRSGVKIVLFPAENKKDFEELEDYLKQGLEVHFVDYYRDVYKIAFVDQNSNQSESSSNSLKKTKKRAKKKLTKTLGIKDKDLKDSLSSLGGSSKKCN